MAKTELVANAALAEKAERYADVVKYMKQVAELGGKLDIKERNLLAVGYKNLVGEKRKSWHIISSIEAKEEDGSDSQIRTAQYRRLIAMELKAICIELLSLLENNLIKRANTPESKVLYNKMKGDLYRYLVEIASSEDRHEAAMDLSHGAYSDAFRIAKAHLDPTDPIRLELALNFSVFYYEILQSQPEACTLAKEAFDNAIGELDKLDEDSFKESSIIMQLLRDNLTLWTSEAATDD